MPSKEDEMIHELKTWPRFFNAVLNGSKPFEVRRNDRDFKTGDELHLYEWDKDWENYTGRRIKATVSFVLDETFPGLAQGFVVLGLQGIEQMKDGYPEPKSPWER